MNPENSIWVLYQIFSTRLNHAVTWLEHLGNLESIMFKGWLSGVELVDPINPDKLILMVTDVTGVTMDGREKVRGPDLKKFEVTRGFQPEYISPDGSVDCISNHLLIRVRPNGWEKEK